VLAAEEGEDQQEHQEEKCARHQDSRIEDHQVSLLSLRALS
jgi:hypothetical protein